MRAVQRQWFGRRVKQECIPKSLEGVFSAVFANSRLCYSFAMSLPEIFRPCDIWFHLYEE